MFKAVICFFKSSNFREDRRFLLPNQFHFPTLFLSHYNSALISGIPRLLMSCPQQHQLLGEEPMSQRNSNSKRICCKILAVLFTSSHQIYVQLFSAGGGGTVVMMAVYCSKDWVSEVVVAQRLCLFFEFNGEGGGGGSGCKLTISDTLSINFITSYWPSTLLHYGCVLGRGNISVNRLPD